MDWRRRVTLINVSTTRLFLHRAKNPPYFHSFSPSATQRCLGPFATDVGLLCVPQGIVGLCQSLQQTKAFRQIGYGCWYVYAYKTHRGAAANQPGQTGMGLSVSGVPPPPMSLFLLRSAAASDMDGCANVVAPLLLPHARTHARRRRARMDCLSSGADLFFDGAKRRRRRLRLRRTKEKKKQGMGKRRLARRRARDEGRVLALRPSARPPRRE